ncbi:GNAT family N-acetyltransferase [Sorangium sp. So ce134]
MAPCATGSVATLEIREATPEDWAWALDVWNVPALCPAAGIRLLVAMVDGKRAGYLAWDWGGGGAIDMLYVAPAHRRRGVATALHGAACATAGRWLDGYKHSPAGRALMDALKTRCQGQPDPRGPLRYTSSIHPPGGNLRSRSITSCGDG